MMERLRTAWFARAACGLAVTLLACALVSGVVPSASLQALDRSLYDARLRLLQAPPEERVVIVDIDERTLTELGWPWSRERMAELIERVVDRGRAAVVGFDIVFADAQADGGEGDARLAEALASRPVVLGYYFSSDRGGLRSGRLPPPVYSADAFSATGLRVTDWNGYGANAPVLQQAARRAGFFNPMIDADGVVRALPLLAHHAGQVYESLGVAMLREYLGDAGMALHGDRLELIGRTGSVSIPMSAGSTVLVPFAGHVREGAPGTGRFAYVSAADVLADRVDWSRFTGRLVLVGTSAPGLTDLRAVPIAETFPGVEIHATTIAGALAARDASPATHEASPLAQLTGAAAAPPRFKQRPDDAGTIAALATGLVGIAFALALPLTGSLGTVALGVLGAGSLLAWNAIAFANFGWVLPASAGFAMMLALVVVNLVVGYFLEGRSRRAVAELFGEYVSPALVSRMMRDPRRYQVMSSENRELTILFADIRGFTRIAEGMSPGALREYINTFLTAMTEVIHRHQGTVDKYIGDAVMAFWGAPIEDPRHADRAVAAAIAMQAEVHRINREFDKRGLPRLAVGIGINTGVVRVGDMGSGLRRAYTVLGDPVNLASRIEGLSKQFNVSVLVGEATARRAQSHVFAELARVSVAGRVEPVRVFVPAALASALPPAVRTEDNRVSPPREESSHEGAGLRM